MMPAEFLNALFTLSPELLVAIGALCALMVGVFARPGSGSTVFVSYATLALLGVVFAIVLTAPLGGVGTAYINDSFARFMKLLTIGGAMVTVFMSIDFLKRESYGMFEVPVLMLLATLGMMVMVSSNNLLSLYMGLELQSLPLYVLAGIDRDNSKSSEAGLKYFVLGALSSGMLLYGISLIYGFTGHIGFEAIAQVLTSETRQLGLLFGIVFVLAGLSFKISAVPFHMWTPDVYEGAPAPITAFFAAAPKMAAMAVTVRVVMEAFYPAKLDWQQVIVFISMASMALGAFAAIGQTNIKRLIAYSSIGHIGFALVGLAAGTQSGVQGVVIYMLTYLIMALGSFALILAMATKEGQVEKISDLAGLSKTNPFMAVMVTALMFSLAGIPPLAGFWAKWYVFWAAGNAHLVTLSIIGVISSVIGAFYYLNIIKIMWIDEEQEVLSNPSLKLMSVLTGSTIFIVFYIFIANLVEVSALQAAKSFF
jgi:NADH-quinone oxidoreductase subunit N